MSVTERLVLAGFASARVLANLLDLAGVLLIGAVVALALGGSNSFPTSLNFLDWLTAPPLSLVFLAAALLLCKSLLSLFLLRKTLLFLARVETRASMTIASEVLGGNLENFKQFSRSDAEWGILRSSSVAFTILLGEAVTLLAELSLAIGVFLLLLAIDWETALAVTFYFAAVLALFQYFSGKKVAKAGATYAKSSVAVNQEISNLSNVFMELKVTGRSAQFFDFLRTARNEVSKSAANYAFVMVVPRVIAEIGLVIGALSFLGIQYLLFGDGLDLSLIAIFLMGGLRIMSAMLPISRATMAMRFEGSKAESAQQLLLRARERHPTQEAKVSMSQLPLENSGSLSAHGHSISLKDVSFSYSEDSRPGAVIDRVNLEIPAGSVAALVGPSGAGKSTLVNLVLGLLAPTKGSVDVRDSGGNPVECGATGTIAYVPQKPGLLFGSFRENITLTKDAGAIDRVRLLKAVETSGLSRMIDALPLGLDTSVGERADSMSGGQIQRIGLARALYQNPKLLVLDEATSSLDAESEEAISRALEQSRGSLTLLIVAHRLATVKSADCVHVVDGGQIVESGTFQNLRLKNSVVSRYANLMDLQ